MVTDRPYSGAVAERWTLNRAGIINVFQYDDETIHFGGGRLLLRGVNGSGKSTAMNMLLPFLLEADVRRIDAAGDQSAVLRSWMLSGREEQQPIGYLWIEFALATGAGDRGGDAGDAGDGGTVEHLVFGCGIKANQSTENVKHWWFITDRRPGIDLALVESGRPLSTEALRGELGSHAVFSKEQRGAYRNEVANRLYGGADLERHMRLLHVVRSPRVGDRISTELQHYLADALPQLSERALDDAAQPLEDLEEFRNNVEDLTRTAETLGALSSVYRSYTRGDLRGRATALKEHGSTARQARRSATQAQLDAEQASAARTAADTLVQRLVRETGEADAALRALENSDEYRQGRQLDELRQQVARLGEAIASTARAVERAADELGRADDVVRDDARSASGAHHDLATSAAELTSTALSTGLVVRPFVVPAIHRDVGDQDQQPADVVETGPLLRGLGEVRAAAQARKTDLQRLRDALTAVVACEQQFVAAEARVGEAGERVEASQDRLDRDRSALSEQVETWRAGMRNWAEQLADACDAAGIGLVLDPDELGAPILIDRRVDLVESLRRDADRLGDHHQQLLATTEGHIAALDVRISALDDELDELSRRTHPDPPIAAWQDAGSAWRLADLVDFADHLGATEQVGLESALEASGLLGAEVRADGSLVTTDGELIARPGSRVAAPLSALLVVTLPDPALPAGPGDPEDRGPVPPASGVLAVLESISVDLDSGEHSIVVADGSFRLGALTGRSLKTAAEHIGSTARRAALERRRKELADTLDGLRTEHADLSAAAGRTAGLLAAARAMRSALPDTGRIDEALRRVRLDEERVESDRVALEDRLVERSGHERELAERSEASQRLSSELRLPVDADELHDIELALATTRTDCDSVERRCRDLVDAHRRWSTAVEHRRLAEVGARAATSDLSAARDAHDPVAMQLASLEDAVGADYAEVLGAIDATRVRLTQLDGDLGAARSDAVESTERAVETRQLAATALDRQLASERTAVAAIPTLIDAAQLPGVWESATADDGDDGDRGPSSMPTVESTAEGALALATAVLDLVQPAERDGVSAESVRQTLRQRRDTLGAGWDAEDHQVDDSLPLVIEVTGPNVSARAALPLAETQVRSSLTQQSGLLTTKQDQALRNLLQGLIAKEVADKMLAARELVELMNARLSGVTTSHGVGTTLRWRRRRDLDDAVTSMIDLLSVESDLRTKEQDRSLSDALSTRIASARRDDPEASYREVLATVLDYREWHDLDVLLLRPNATPQLLGRRTALSEGEKKLVSYLPLFAAVAASCDALAADAATAPRFVLLDDAFAKVSEDNHPRLFGLLVELDLDFIATSERLWGTHASVPELAITEVLRDAELGLIALEHYHWNGRERAAV